MSFDAGSITATLTLDTSKFDADLAKEKAKLDDLTKPREVRLSAVFDNASLSKARKAFADLDNMISRDAAQRLKSSPQGSVLGALNSLFSPHPVSGAPSPQASAASGLLGKMISQQGGGGQAGPAGNQGTAGSNARQVLQGGGPQGNQTSNDYIRQILTGQGAANQETTDKIKQVLTGQTPGNVSTEDLIKQVVTGTTPGNLKTEDLITPKLAEPLPGDVTTTDTVKVVTEGGQDLPKDTDTTDTVHEKLDPADKAKLVTDSGAAGDQSGTSFSSMFTAHAKSLLDTVAGMFGGSGGDRIKDAAGKSGGDAGGGFISDFGVKLIGGIGPVILGMNAKLALIVPAVGTALAALPALAGVIGTGIGVAMIGGLIAGVVAGSPALKAQLTGLAAPAEAALAQIGAPIIPALSKAFAQIPALLKQVTGPLTQVMATVAPQIAGVFNGLTPIIKGLVGIMQAAAPAFGPVLTGLETLVANILPGIQIVIKAMVPFLGQFSGILATLGSHLGQFFSAAAPAIGASMQVLGALLDLIGSLLPVIIKLGSVFATALAPVLASFAAVIKAMEPTLVLLGQIVGELAQALLGDLASAFGAVAQLLIAITPSLNILAVALGAVFTQLENTGVFAELGDAVEALATPLGNLINALVQGLAPSLPGIVTAVGELAGAFTAGLAAAVGAVAVALTAIVKAMPPGTLTAIAEAAVALFVAFKAYSVIQSAVSAVLGFAKAMGIMDLTMDANPISLVVLAIIALGAAFYLAWQKSAGFRTVMEDIAAAVLQFGIVIAQVSQAVVGTFLGMVGDIIDGAAKAFGWVPGLGSKLKGAADAFNSFRDGVNNGYDAMIAKMQGWQNELDGTDATAKTDLGDIETAFTNQSKAADAAKTALDNYTTSVQQNGATSTAAQTARQQLITDLTNAGVNATTAQTDVGNYTTAIATNGATSTAAQTARQQLITDILNASNNANTGTTDLGLYTQAVQQNGATSDAAQAARAKLISDLEAAGVNANTATGLVDGLSGAVNALPAGKNISIDVTGTGTWTITGLQALLGNNSLGTLPTPTGSQHGSKVPGYGGGDIMLALVEPGETILPKEATSDPMTVAVAKKYGVPGFASGGIAGMPGQIITDYNNTQADMVKAMQQALIAALKQAAAAAAAAAASAAKSGAGGGVSGYTTTGAGDYTLSQLEALWIAAGGSPAAAYNMARIAIAESGGDPNAYNPSGATGLWQIEYPGSQVVSGNLYSPMINAENAVALYNSRGYEPWESDPVGAALTGYSQGGPITEPVIGFGQNTGRGYVFGEHGNEYVTPGGGDKLDKLAALMSRLIDVTGSLPHGISGNLGAALGGAAMSASMHTRYPRGGA